MFEFLFKYPAAFYRDGSIELAGAWWLYGCLVATAGIFLLWISGYAHVRGDTDTRDRGLLIVLRTAVVALVILCLLQPTLVVPVASEGRSVVGILLDDSRSMRIADVDDLPRHETLATHFGTEQTNLLTKLSRRFDFRMYGFGTDTKRIGSLRELSFEAGRTDIGEALTAARADLSGLPLAALVVFSDGADNSDPGFRDALTRLRSEGVPVHTVGIGQTKYRNDLEIGPIEAPASALRDSNLVLSVPVRARGLESTRISVILEDDGQILDMIELEAPGDNAVALARLDLEVREPGLRRLRVRVPPQESETVIENNQRELLLDVRDRAERVLHFEGEPRFEVKFLRRALAEDRNLEIVSLIRTAENKFYRVGLDDSDELAQGFPKTREDLFRYRGLILGSVEASFFDRAQLEMIAEFVNIRGGGLLFLGGRRSFSEGGFQDTPLAELSPMLLEPRHGSIVPMPAQVAPTDSGLMHPITRLGDTGEYGPASWSSLPALTVVNPIRQVKLGATPLLWAPGPDNSEPLQILAVQRFGRGRVAAFAVRNSWQWKMHPDIEPDDRTHEIFWRQLLRWLVQSTPDRLELTAPRDMAPGETVTVSASLRDENFASRSDAPLRLAVRAPNGVEQPVTMLPRPDAPGHYETRFRAEQPGLYEFKAETAGSGEQGLLESVHVRSHPGAHEYYGAEMQAATLKRIAAATGGSFYTPEQLPSLVDDLSRPRKGSETSKRLPLWNLPLLLLLILALLSGEWFYRRRRGLV